MSLNLSELIPKLCDILRNKVKFSVFTRIDIIHYTLIRTNCTDDDISSFFDNGCTFIIFANGIIAIQLHLKYINSFLRDVAGEDFI